MKEAINVQGCERSEDLISFLYGELDEREARTFEQHRRNCSRCESELAAFGSVRQSILSWRDQSLALTPGSSFAPSASVETERKPKRTSLAAIRVFFEMSPMWLKGATAFAAVLFCVLAGLTFARLVEKPQPPLAPNGASFRSAQDIEAEVKRRVEAEVASLKSRRERSVTDDVVERSDGHANAIRPRNAAPRNIALANPSAQKLRRSLTRAEREQLAADLRLISGDDEDALQLLGDRINR